MLNIHRIDHEASHTHCWRVTVQRRTRIYVRSFSDGRYGGAEQALVAATTYRDALIRSNPPLSKPVYCAILKKTNRSGISGLSRIDRWEFSKGRRVHRLYWDVQWPIENCQSRHKKFSILKYGEVRAGRGKKQHPAAPARRQLCVDAPQVLLIPSVTSIMQLLRTGSVLLS